ncbi:MAG: reverse transcriptase domain-containing protein [Rhizonema sp. PD38]|nr:reverse transcriptase domain-containing protein [Rhizonema sp. PD38]
MVNDFSERWKSLPWKKFRKNLLRLQVRLYKAYRVGDTKRARQLQKLILKSTAARMLAIRQVTQLNKGKKTAGIDGKKCLTFKERFELDEMLRAYTFKWQHSKLREIQIPKKDGNSRILKVPSIKDRAWQCLIKYAIEPAHEATFHARSYGFRPGRSTQDAQKYVFELLSKGKNNTEKRVLELDIEKCFDRINHNKLMELIFAPQSIKIGLWRCLKIGANPEFPQQGTPQGGVVSPLLANIALNGVEEIHTSVRYADDMVFVLKPGVNAGELLKKIEEFLTERGLNIKASKTKLVMATDGFDFLGWHINVQKNGKFRSVPSEENFKAFKNKVKYIVNNSSYGAPSKAQKLAPIVRGWRNYHRYCKLDGSRFSLWSIEYRAFTVFNKEEKMNRAEAISLSLKAFPDVKYSENKHILVKADKSVFDGDIVYWSKRNAKEYNGLNAKLLKKQNHACGYCGMKFLPGEDLHLHHIDGNHDNWKDKNLIVVHQSCHQYHHMKQSES